MKKSDNSVITKRKKSEIMKNKFRLGIVNINDDSEEVELLHQQQHSQDHHQHHQNRQQSETELYDNDANFDEFITQQFNLITEELNVEDLPLAQSPPELSTVLSTGNSNSDLIHKSLINMQPENINSASPTKTSYVTNSIYKRSMNGNNGRGVSGQIQMPSNSQSFDELTSKCDSYLIFSSNAGSDSQIVKA